MFVLTTQALSVLSTSTSQTEQQEAQTFMLELQAAPCGWDLASAMLERTEGEGSGVCNFFGAKILASKVVNDWESLDEESRDALQALLFSHIQAYDSGPMNVLTRLCVAFASLVLRCVDQLDGFVGYLIQEMADTPTALVQLLTILPEEFQRANVGTRVRNMLRTELLGQAAPVLSALEEMLAIEGASLAFQRKVLYTFLAWIEFELPHALVMDSPLLSAAFDALSVPDLFSVGVDIIDEVVRLPRLQRYPRDMQALITGLVARVSFAEDAYAAQEYEVVKGLARIAASMIDVGLEWMMDNVLHDLLALFRILTLCVASPKRSALELSVPAWTEFADTLVTREPNAESRTSPSASHLIQSGLALFQELISLTLSRARLSVEWETLDPFDTNYWQLVRRDCADLFESCCKVLGPVSYFSGALNHLYAQIEAAHQSDPEDHAWREVEAALFAIRVVSDYLPRDASGAGNFDSDDDDDDDEQVWDASRGMWKSRPRSNTSDSPPASPSRLRTRSASEPEPSLSPVSKSKGGRQGASVFDSRVYLPAVLDTFSSLPMHPRVAKSAIKLVGSFADRMGRQANEGVSLILPGLGEAYLQTTAAAALRDLCASCAGALVDSLPEMVTSLAGALDALPMRPRLLALESIGYVIAQADAERASSALNTLTTPLVEGLERVMSSPTVASLDGIAAVVEHVNLISAVCRFVTPSLGPHESHPVMHVMERAWPVVEAVFGLAPDSEAVMAALMQFIGNVIRATQKAFDPCLEMVLWELTRVYNGAPNSPLLNVIETAISIFDDSTSMAGIREGLLENISETTLKMFQSSEDAVIQHPGVVRGYFSLLLATLRKYPSVLLESSFLETIFHTGINAFQASERWAISSSFLFFEAFFEVSPSSPNASVIDSAFEAFGHQLLKFCVDAVAGALPRSMESKPASLLFALAHRYPHQVGDMLESWFESNPEWPSRHATPESKSEFITLIRSARAKSRFRKMVKKISLLWRGLENTPYGTAFVFDPSA